MPSAALLEAVAVTAELCGRTFSEPAARVFVADLSAYPEHQVMGALTRCRKEVRGVLTVADVVSRLEDGRPGAEEAWAMLPMREADTAVWTDEMREAWAVALPLVEAREIVAARMAFKETYLRLVSQAREKGAPPVWAVTLGHDAAGREAAVMKAVDRGYIPLELARDAVPALAAPSPKIMALLAPKVVGA